MSIDNKEKEGNLQKNPKTCPGLRDFIQPKPSYTRCHVCSAELEVWSDEDKTTCTSCGAEWTRPDDNAACLSYCQYADKCRAIIAERKK